MALEILRCVGHGEIRAAVDSLAAVASQSASLDLSRLALLGQIAYLFELLLGSAIVAIGIVGVFRCSRLTPSDFDALPIHAQCNSSGNEPQSRDQDSSRRDADVTIRLDEGFLRALHRRRCIVTIREPLSSVHSAGREVWYAREEK